MAGKTFDILKLEKNNAVLKASTDVSVNWLQRKDRRNNQVHIQIQYLINSGILLKNGMKTAGAREKMNVNFII